MNNAHFMRSDIWFEDGNVILIAKNVTFKVHRGQLARHSDIFYDLFSIPQPKDQPVFEGCSMVELHDSPSDLTYLLRALYDGLYFYKPYVSDWPAIEAVIRLSTKYFIDHLRNRCLSSLILDWPITLDRWDARERDSVDEKGRYCPRDLTPNPVLMINLARELDQVSFVLPSAFYDLSRYGPRKIVSGTIAPSPIDFADPPSSSLSTMAQLSTEDMVQVLTGREHGQRYMISFFEHTLINPPISSHCFNRQTDHSQSCRQACYFVMLNTFRSVGGISFGRDADPLFTLLQTEGLLDRTDFNDGMDPKVRCGLNICSACKANFKKAIKDAREDIWSLLPAWFGLPSYEQLQINVGDR